VYGGARRRHGGAGRNSPVNHIRGLSSILWASFVNQNQGVSSYTPTFSFLHPTMLYKDKIIPDMFKDAKTHQTTHTLLFLLPCTQHRPTPFSAHGDFIILAQEPAT